MEYLNGKYSKELITNFELRIGEYVWKQGKEQVNG